jgi:membrane protein
VSDLRDALRREAQAEVIRAEVERQIGPELQRVLHASEEECRSSAQNVTLRELAALLDRGSAATAGPAQVTHPPARPPGTRPVLDAK